MKTKKPKQSGSVTFGLKAERNLGWAGAPCEGYYNLVEHTSDDRTARINSPTMFDLIGRVLGSYPEFGSEFEVVVSVRVMKSAAPSREKCHNPWPAHRCPK